MSSILSGLLAVIIALTGMCGGMGSAGVEKAVIVDAAAYVDGDLSPLLQGIAGGDEESLSEIVSTVKGISDLLKALSLRFSADQSAAQFAVLVNGDPAASASVKANEAGDGWNVISTLFPSTVLTVSQETLDQTMKSLMDAAAGSMPFDLEELKQLDMQAIMENAMTVISETINSFQASVGEPETGSYEINGVEYTVKVPYNMSMKEAGILLVTAAKKILSEESLSAFLAKNIPGFSLDKLDETLESMQNADEADMAPLEAAMYTNEAGNVCLQVAAGPEDEALKLVFAMTGNVISITLNGMGLDAVCTADNDAGKYDLKASFSAGDTSVSMTGTVTVVSENEVNVAASVSASSFLAALNLTVTGSENRMDLNGSLSVNMIPIMVKGYVAVAEDRNEMEFSLSVPISQDAPPTLTVKGSMAYGDAPAFDAEGLNAVSFESLSQDQAAAEALSGEIAQSIGNLLESLKTQFPIIEALTQGTDQPSVQVDVVPAE